MTTLCLVMIVKDEEKVIERCLRSAIPVISSWCIVDTGSTDKTKEIIREVMKDIPGELHERPWKNFAHNRTEMIVLANGKADYNVMLDADDVLVVPDGFVLPELTHHRYNLMVKHRNVAHSRPHVFKNDAGFYFESVLHEYLHRDGETTTGKLDGIEYRVIGGGVRVGGDPVGKYMRDAALLIKEISRDPKSHLVPRYTFYLAQSYRDAAICMLAEPATPVRETATTLARERLNAQRTRDVKKLWEKALRAYEKRATQGSYYQEVFVSLVEAGKLHESLKSPEKTIHDTYIRAYEYLPERGPEALHYLSRYYRWKDRFHLAYLYAKMAVTLPQPEGLFVEHDIYAWRMRDELAVNAYHTSRFVESYSINRQILARPDGIPSGDLARLEANLRFSKEKIEAAGGVIVEAKPAAPPEPKPEPAEPVAASVQ